MPEIEPAKTGDAERLAKLAERTFRDTFAAENTRENMQLHCAANYSRDRQAAEIADRDVLTLLSRDDGELVGYAQMRWRTAPACVAARMPAEIQRLYVARAWHGRGVAHDLMRACLAEAAARAVDVVWLGVWERNPRALAFYRKFGFAEVGDHVFTLGEDRQRDLIMARAV